MSRSLGRRLKKLEAIRGPTPRTHVVVGEDEAAAERQIADLKASGQYREGDFVLRLPWLEEAALKKHGRHE